MTYRIQASSCTAGSIQAESMELTQLRKNRQSVKDANALLKRRRRRSILKARGTELCIHRRTWLVTAVTRLLHGSAKQLHCCSVASIGLQCMSHIFKHNRKHGLELISCGEGVLWLGQEKEGDFSPHNQITGRGKVESRSVLITVEHDSPGHQLHKPGASASCFPDKCL